MSSGTKDVDVSRSQQSLELSLHLIRCYTYYIKRVTEWMSAGQRCSFSS